MSLKVVYNDDYGGFRLSDEAICKYFDLYKEVYGSMDRCPSEDDIRYGRIKRHDCILVHVIDTMSPNEYNTWGSDIKIKEVKGNDYNMTTYDGAEIITEIGEPLPNPEGDD